MAQPITILYIEDDPGSRRLVQRTLSYAGYQVVSAASALTGLDLAKTIHPNLILIDIDLPDMTGREVTTLLRRDVRLRDTPIVALTGQTEQVDREKGMAAGMTGYLHKPIDIRALPSLIDFYLQGGKDAADADSIRKAQIIYSKEVVARLEAKVRELEQSNSGLMRVDRVKDAFIQLTSHELRTPLTLVYGYNRLLHDALAATSGQDPELVTLVDGLNEAIERMGRVINEILITSRIASGWIELKPNWISLADLLRRVLVNYADALAERRLTIQYTPVNWEITIYADSELLSLAFSNLLSNAIKYTPDGGTVVLSCHPEKANVQIRVQDSGVGIALADQKKIFERFYTAENMQLHSTSKTAFRGGGLGLGLPIARGIVEAHGGRIWVDSEGLNEAVLPGSTFYLELPIRPMTDPHHPLPPKALFPEGIDRHVE